MALTMFPIALDSDHPVPDVQEFLHRSITNDGKVLGSVPYQVFSCRYHSSTDAFDADGDSEWISRVMIRVDLMTCLSERLHHGWDISLPFRCKPDLKRSRGAMAGQVWCRVLSAVHLGWDSIVESLQILESPPHLLPAEVVVAHDPRPFLEVITGTNTVATKVDHA
jgi:hypothetical protein